MLNTEKKYVTYWIEKMNQVDRKQINILTYICIPTYKYKNILVYI